MVLNQQESVEVNVRALSAYLGRIRTLLDLRGRELNVCLVDDRTIRRLNAAHRGKARPTDVLAYPWADNSGGIPPEDSAQKEFANFLGDVVISAETAARNARREGHSVEREAEWLMLHGVLHLLGFDHEADHGEMVSLEVALRSRLDGNAVRWAGRLSRAGKDLRHTR
jgi:rRNA maturation RNase YbeY